MQIRHSVGVVSLGTITVTSHERHRVSNYPQIEYMYKAAYENMSTESHKPLFISNDWMKIMLYGYPLLSVTYLNMFSMKVSCKSTLYMYH